MLTIRSILHATDFSDVSSNAFRLACCLAEDYRAPLHILHVATAFEAYKGELISKDPSAPYLAKDWQKLREHKWPGIEIHCHLEEGEATEQIIRVADSIGCDFIVIGSYGRSGFRRFFLGSVAEHVLRHANCQVVIVKAPVSMTDDPAADRQAIMAAKRTTPTRPAQDPSGETP
jgi:universal stress protein A